MSDTPDKIPQNDIHNKSQNEPSIPEEKYSDYKPDPNKYIAEQESIKDPLSSETTEETNIENSIISSDDWKYMPPSEAEKFKPAQEDPAINNINPSEPEPEQIEKTQEPEINKTSSKENNKSQEFKLTEEIQFYTILCHLSNVLLITIVWVPLIFYFAKKDNDYIRFHAKQTAVLGAFLGILMISLAVMSFIVSVLTFGCGTICMIFLVPLITLIPWIYCCYTTFKVVSCENYRIPYIADLVDKEEIC